MNSHRLQEITSRYRHLRVAVVGDFCLDRYLEIDPARIETSIETGLGVHNVMNVRAQPGAAGTILNNLVALGIGSIRAVGFCGEDGEGYELLRALRALPGVNLSHFVQTPLRRTFTYCKPLLLESGHPPRELNRLDSKNWTPTPPELSRAFAAALAVLRAECDAVILMDQVDIADTGVLTRELLAGLRDLDCAIPILADSRRGLHGYPPCIFKMNAAELAALSGCAAHASLAEISCAASQLAVKNRRAVFITLAERGIVGAAPDGYTGHVPAVPVHGPIDVVGAGDSVTANLAAALAAGASLGEAMELAALASSVVLHQLGTSGAARVGDIEALLDASK